MRSNHLLYMDCKIPSCRKHYYILKFCWLVFFFKYGRIWKWTLASFMSENNAPMFWLLFLEALFFKTKSCACQEMNHFIILLGLGAGIVKCITIYLYLKCLFCTASTSLVSITAAAQYHCSTNQEIKEATIAAPTPPPQISSMAWKSPLKIFIS